MMQPVDIYGVIITITKYLKKTQWDKWKDIKKNQIEHLELKIPLFEIKIH